MNTKGIILLIIRLAVAFFFIQSGLMKLGPVTDGMINFVGGAFHNLGLTFFTPEMWVTILGVGEIFIGLGLILGGLTRGAAGFAIIIMLGAMNAKGWNINTIIKDILLMIGSIVLIITGAGLYSLDARCCMKRKCSGGCSPKDPYKGKEVIEA